MPAVCSSSTHRLWWHFVPSLLVAAGITYMSLIKAVPFQVMGDIPLADKWGHMLAYLVLAICMAGDGLRARLRTKTLYMISVLLPIAYGGLMEIVQLHCPPRSAEWTDWLADGIGTAIGVVLFGIYHLLSRKFSRKTT